MLLEQIEKFLALYNAAIAGKRDFQYWEFRNILDTAMRWRLWEHTAVTAEKYKNQIDFLIAIKKEIEESHCDRSEDYTSDRLDGLYLVKIKERENPSILEFSSKPRKFDSSGWSSKFHHWTGYSGFNEIPVAESEIEEVLEKIDLKEFIEVACRCDGTSQISQMALSIAVKNMDNRAISRLIAK